VKIFDFGLAKEVDPDQRLEDGTYKLTADTGSLRYMAPEVSLGKPITTLSIPFRLPSSVGKYSLLILLIPHTKDTVSSYSKSLSSEAVIARRLMRSGVLRYVASCVRLLLTTPIALP